MKSLRNPALTIIVDHLQALPIFCLYDGERFVAGFQSTDIGHAYRCAESAAANYRRNNDAVLAMCSPNMRGNGQRIVHQ